MRRAPRIRPTTRGSLVAAAVASMLLGWLTFGLARATGREPGGSSTTFLLLVTSSLGCAWMLGREWPRRVGAPKARGPRS